LIFVFIFIIWHWLIGLWASWYVLIFFFVRLFLSHILDRELLKLSWVCSGFFLSSSICSHFWGDFSNFFRVTRVASFFFFFCHPSTLHLFDIARNDGLMRQKARNKGLTVQAIWGCGQTVVKLVVLEIF
jgi:hypothetical protein